MSVGVVFAGSPVQYDLGSPCPYREKDFSQAHGEAPKAASPLSVPGSAACRPYALMQAVDDNRKTNFREAQPSPPTSISKPVPAQLSYLLVADQVYVFGHFPDKRKVLWVDGRGSDLRALKFGGGGREWLTRVSSCSHGYKPPSRHP